MSQNGHNPLTDRQTELLSQVASGLTVEQAARESFVAPQSAYNILSSARSRAEVQTMAQLCVKAVVEGWIEKGDDEAYHPAVSHS